MNTRPYAPTSLLASIVIAAVGMLANCACAGQTSSRDTDSVYKVQAGVLSAPGRMVIYDSPNFALYIEVELLPGPEPRKPAKVDIWSTPAWVYRPFLERSKHKLVPNELNHFTGCQHSPELFDQLNSSFHGDRGKNDFSQMLPLAIRCDQGQFLFLLLKKSDIGARFLQGQNNHHWLTRQIKLVWWASREELVPLEDLSGIVRPRDIITRELRARQPEK